MLVRKDSGHAMKLDQHGRLDMSKKSNPRAANPKCRTCELCFQSLACVLFKSCRFHVKITVLKMMIQLMGTRPLTYETCQKLFSSVKWILASTLVSLVCTGSVIPKRSGLRVGFVSSYTQTSQQD